jgi:septum formation protein
MRRYRLVLVSASPRRLDLLRGMGLSPIVVPSCVREHPAPDESPGEMVARLAEAKARLVAGCLSRHTACYVVLAADTSVVIDGRALGKPRDRGEAEAMLRLLRGRSHEVLTGVFLLRTDDGRSTRGVELTRVRFRDYEDSVIRTYVESGEPMDKAGAYAIQGGGAQFAEQVDGSWSNVVGLPLERLPGWLAHIGIELSWLVDGTPVPANGPAQPLDSTNSS